MDILTDSFFDDSASEDSFNVEKTRKKIKTINKQINIGLHLSNKKKKLLIFSEIPITNI